MEDKGYLVLAQNNPKVDYLRQAYALALSIKNSQSTVNGITLATDVNPCTLSDKYHRVFDKIVPIPWQDHAKDSAWKIENKWKYYYMTPYRETVILDSDMLFPEDISHWWDHLSTRSFWSASQPLTFRGTPITSTRYRDAFVTNNLPNIYTAFTYFKKDEYAAEIFALVETIFNNWELFYYEFLNEDRPKFLSGDVAYALAIKLLGIEHECTGNLSIPTFVHMKAHLQGIRDDLITENWPQHLPTYFSNDGRFKIGNYQQTVPFHYHVKDWLTDSMIEILEARVL